MARILAHSQDAAAATLAIAAALNGENNHRADFTLLTGERPHHIRLKLFDVTDSAGTRMGRGRILQDITQRYELDRMKSTLIATVSHELRTPLAAIKGYTSTLLADDVEWDPQSQREFLDIISLETDHLSELVNDLLDMSRIEAGNLKVSRVTCELSDLIHHAAKRSHLQPERRLQITLPLDLPPLYVDAQRIEAVLRNLIENAAKYSGENSPIRISAERQNGDLIVRVQDEGPGIALEHRGRVFDSFYRAEDGLARSTTGAGLGLAISQGFVRAHGGNIWLEQRAIGTCVAFSLPLTTEATI
jgi:signal transduction histidine kinase